MAIIIQGLTKCPICNGDLDRPYTATSGCAFPPDHHLFSYCDAALHYSFLEAWKFRQEFSKEYFDQACQAARQRPAGLLLDREEWALLCGPAVPGKKPYYVQVRFRDWPMSLHSKWEQWESLLSGGETRTMEGSAVLEAECVIETLRDELPSQELLDALYERKRA